MQKISIALSLSISLCNLYDLKAETLYIENNSNYDYVGAFVYVRGNKVSGLKVFFSIPAYDRTKIKMPKPKPLKGSRYLYVTSLYRITPDIFHNRYMGSMKNIQQDDTANSIQIGRGGLIGSKKTRIIIDRYSESRPNLSVDETW